LVTDAEMPLYGLSAEVTSQFNAAELAAQKQSVTDSALGWMKPTVTPPLISWGSDIRSRATDLIKMRLKSAKGMAPPGANVGDDQVRADAAAAEAWFKGVGVGSEAATDLVGSSVDGTAAILAYPTSDTPRGW
jgi:hypothetical protein